MADEDYDELDAFMANLKENEEYSNPSTKKPKIDLIDPDDSDSEGPDPSGDGSYENIEADLKAVIAGTNAPSNKVIKRLTELGKRDVNYRPFKKEFYVEVPELAKLSNDEVKELRESLENIKVIGKSCPKPVTCWAQCGLSRKIMDVLKKCQYLSPTPIQAQAIPAIMSGRDVIGIAKTGCGKTLSFLLPMFRHVLDQPKLGRGDGPIGLIITPTRELATQICNDAQKFTRNLGLRVVTVYGGPNISEQIGMLKPGAEIVVCTPGRMIEILTVNGGRVTNLNRCTFLVLDEADRLFDMGFEKQIRSIVDLIRPDRQTVMFSATFPKIMEAHARKILTHPIEIQVGGRSVVCKDVEQHIEIIEEDDKFLRLLQILQKHVDHTTSAIVFVAKQEKADSLLEDLLQAYDPNCLVLHGGIDKDDRISTFADFKSGQARVLVATSVAARGLDVKNCICVVNYDCTNHYEDYVHRCGRTGRAGNKGFAYTFLTPDQGNHASDIIKALHSSGNEVPAELQKLWDDYIETAERLGKKVWTSSGFSGRGFKFDEAEAQLVNEKKKYQRRSLGLQHSDDEDDDGTNVGQADGDSDVEVDASTLESEIKNLAGGKTELSKPVIRKVGAASKVSEDKKVVTTSASENLSKLDIIQQNAALILSKKKGLDPSTFINNQTSQSIPVKSNDNRCPAARAKPSHPVAGPDSALVESKTEHHEQSTGQGTSIISSIGHPAKERLEMKLEINDYHQQVRRRLTSKEALAKISESCEVGITVRGQYCQQGDRPLEPKLYLAIEGTSEPNLEKARFELLLLVKDEYTRINSLPPSRSRYRLL